MGLCLNGRFGMHHERVVLSELAKNEGLTKKKKEVDDTVPCSRSCQSSAPSLGYPMYFALTASDEARLHENHQSRLQPHLELCLHHTHRYSFLDEVRVRSKPFLPSCRRVPNFLCSTEHSHTDALLQFDASSLRFLSISLFTQSTTISLLPVPLVEVVRALLSEIYSLCAQAQSCKPQRVATLQNLTTIVSS